LELDNHALWQCKCNSLAERQWPVAINTSGGNEAGQAYSDISRRTSCWSELISTHNIIQTSPRLILHSTSNSFDVTSHPRPALGPLLGEYRPTRLGSYCPGNSPTHIVSPPMYRCGVPCTYAVWGAVRVIKSEMARREAARG
jgi:hypothetical protein